MSNFWINPDSLFDGTSIKTGASLRIVDGVVTEISSAPQKGLRIHGCLAPGFIDLQVNGGGGILLNDVPTREGMIKIAAAHQQFGTVAILPTVITDRPEVLDQVTDAAIAAKGEPGILGLHIEGPHISVQRRGTHEASFVRPMDERTLNAVRRLRAAEVSVMITLAPEAATLSQIAHLVSLGAVVSLGHTDATAEQVDSAIAAGATCGTHLFNAMSPMQSRAPGAVGAILTSEVCFGMICDGYHVDDRMVTLALSATNRERPFLVSDAMATIGGGDTFELYGRTVRLKEGRLINSEGNLAGAHITQAQGVRRLVSDIGRSLEDALHMAITTPAKVIGHPDLASPNDRAIADLILIAEDLSVTAASTHISGENAQTYVAT